MIKASLKERLWQKIKRKLNKGPFEKIHSNLSVFNTIEDFLRFMRWDKEMILLEDNTHERQMLVDINNRRRIDAKIVSLVVANLKPKYCLEIGTSTGESTARIAVNAPHATVYTVNIGPEEYSEGGSFKTHKLARDEIGHFYRTMRLENIEQIYANTASWEPDLPLVDFAFIDGSHDAEFVINDTCKVIKTLGDNGCILWHDFNPDLYQRFDWINSVMMGIERLYMVGILSGDIFHIRNSWICVKCFSPEELNQSLKRISQILS